MNRIARANKLFKPAAFLGLFLVAFSGSSVLAETVEYPLTSENTTFTVVQGFPEDEASTSYPGREVGQLYRTHWDGRSLVSVLYIDELPEVDPNRIQNVALKIFVTKTNKWGTADSLRWAVRQIPPASENPDFAWNATSLTFASAGPELQKILRVSLNEKFVAAEQIGPLGEPEASRWYSVDITDMVKSWLQDPGTNNGIVITPADRHDLGYGFAEFASPFNDFEHPESTPRLVIDLNP